MTFPEPMLLAAFAGGLVLILFGGQLLVAGALSLGRSLGLSPLLAGLLIVGIGASAPELFVSVNASAGGKPGLAIGNIVGSNISNIFFVLALPALIMPFQAGGAGQKRAWFLLLIATIALVGISLIRPLDFAVGIFLLLIYVGVLGFTLVTSMQAHARGEDHGLREGKANKSFHPLLSIVFIAAGLAGLMIAANLMMDSGVGLAEHFNVPQEWIGLTMLAVGTSLPEIGASLAAAIRRKGDLLVGNVLGSSVFNLLAVGGASAVAGPLEVAKSFPQYDYWAMGLGLLLLGAMIFFKAKVGRLTAIFLLLLYAVYIYGLINGFNLAGLLPQSSA